MAGQDAELQLKVSLDLAFFRQQLSTIGAQLGGQSLQLNVQFNRKSIADQYRLLDRYVRGRKFNVELNLVGGLTKNEFDKIKGRLDDLRALRKVEIPIGIKNGATGKDVDKTIASIKERLAQNQQIKQGGGKLRIETSVKPSVTNEDIAVFKKAVKDKLSKIGALEIPTKLDVPKVEDLLKALQKNINRQKPLLVQTSIKPSILSADVKAFKKAAESKLSGITVKINAELETIGGGKTKAQIEKEVLAGLERIQQMGAERMGGGVTEPARRESLRQSLQGRDIGELKDIGKQLGVAGVGKFRNTQNLIERIVAEASIEMITKYLDPQAVMRNPDRSGLNKVLDTFARGLFNMLGMDVASMRQQAAQQRALPSVNFPATVPSRPVSIGPSSTGRALPAGAGPAGMIGAAQAPAGLLPSITARSSIKSGVEALFAAGGPQFPMAPSGKLALSTEALQARVDKILADYFKIAEVTVKEIFNPQDLKRALNIFSYLPQALRDAESRTRQARIGVTSAQGIAGLLPAAAGRAPSTYSTGAIGGESREQMMARRTAEAYARSALRGVSIMSEKQPALPGTTFMGDAFVSGGGRDRVRGSGQAPERGGALGFRQSPLTREYFENAQRYSAALEIARATSARFTASQLPLVGGLKEVASEFGFAIKQVFLFGAAYQALAFVQRLPGQFLDAAKSQQQYSNALQTATQDTGTFAKELLYVDNVQRAFGLNLETTRSGFVRLYASMAPANFDSGSIEKLFTGISAATAALQLTPDKAERVIYAFGQMASKGQIMSEELRGQLGDVLPGALAIFAKAAGMSVREFSKAMEDGEFVGSKFRDTFAKVADELMKRFGTGAQAAGKSLQGLLNTVQGDFQRTLESFAPLANAAAQAILGPLGGSLKQLSMSAQIATGEVERTFGQLKQAQKDLADLKIGGADASEIKAAEKNVAALAARYQVLQEAVKDPAIAKQAQDIQLFTQELAKAGTFVMNTAKAIGGMLSPILNVLGTNLTTVISLITSFYIGFQTARLAAMALMGILLTYRALSTILGFGPATLGANALAGAFNILGVAATGATVKTVGLTIALRVFAATTILGAIIGGITLIAGAFATMRDRAKEASDQSKNAAENAARAASMGDVMGVTTELNNELAKNRAVSKSLATLDKIYQREKDRMKLGYKPLISVEDMAALKQGADYSNEIAGILAGNQMKAGKFELQAFRGQELERARRQAGQISAEVRKSSTLLKAQQAQALEQQKKIGLNVPTPSSTKPETEAPDEEALKKAQQAAEKAANQQQQLAMDAAKRQNDLDKARFEHLISMNESVFDHWKSLQDDKFNYEIAGMNSIEARQRKFQKDLQDIEIRRIETIRKAELETAKAVQESQAAARVSAAAGGGVTGLYQGNTGISSGAHFDIRRADRSRITEAEARALLDPSVSRRLQMTSGYGRRVSPVPGASSFHAGIDLAGPANTPLNLAPGYSLQGVGQEGGLGYTANVRGPQGEMYKVGHLQPPGASYTRQRRAEGAGGKQDVTQINVAYKATEQLTNVQNAYDLALKQTATTIKSNIASIFPVAELQLETSLMKIRNQLQLQGMPAEYIKYKEELFKAEYEAAEAVKKHKENISEFEQRRDSYTKKQQEGAELTGKERRELDYLNRQIALNKEGMAALTEQQKAYNIASLESAIATMKQADALKAMEEVSGRINDAVEGVTGTYKSLFKEIAMGEDSVEALKKAQDALADRALTMFLDFAMKPVEDFFRKTLGSIFGVPDEETKRKETLAKLEAQLAVQKEIAASTKQTAINTGQGATMPSGATQGQAMGLASPAGDSSFSYGGGNISPLTDFISGQFATDLSSGLNSLQSSADAYASALSTVDASVRNSTINISNAAEEAGPNGATGKKWQESLGKTVQGIGIAAGSIMGIAAGISQVKKGGTANVLGGIGSILLSVGGAIGGFGKLFAGGSAGQFGTSSSFNGTAGALGAAPFAPKLGAVFANGGIARGGFRAFANGGVVGGPTLGLVGEGRYNEAVVPLPDGKSIPVQLGGSSSRDLISPSSGANVSPVLSMSFETTTINGVEYVSRDQLETAMMETRRLAAKDGANRGAALAIDRLQHSPNTRRRIGMR